MLVTTKGGSAFAAHPEVGLLGIRLEDAAEPAGDGESAAIVEEQDEEGDGEKGGSRVPGVEIGTLEEYEAAIRAAEVLPDTLPGIIARAETDPDHWLTAGLPPTVHILLSGSAIFTPLRLDQGVNAVRYAGPDEVATAGHLWDENRRQLAYKPFAVVEPRGRGLVIGFTGEPTFRAYVRGLDLLFLNAVVRGPAHTRP